MDVFAFVLHFQCFAVVAFAVADVARDVDVGQKVHFDFQYAIAFAGFATAAFDVERKTARLITALFRGRYLSEQFAHRREQAGVGRGIGARGAANRRLIDVNHFVEMFQAVNLVVWRRLLRGAVDLACGGQIQRFVDQCGFARAGYACDAGHQADGQTQFDVFQIVATRAFDHQFFFGFGAAFFRYGDFAFAREEMAGGRIGVVFHFARRALRHHLAAVLACARPHVHHVVGGADHVFVVFNHNHGVVQIAQVFERADQAVVVALMQTDGGLVQHVHHAG